MQAACPATAVVSLAPPSLVFTCLHKAKDEMNIFGVGVKK